MTATHIIDKPPTVYVESQKQLNDILSKYLSESANVLDTCRQLAVAKVLNIETAIAEGDAASKIADYAKKEGFDMIVIGSRDLGQFKEMVIGSVSNTVLHHTKYSYSS